jgi:radical SAM protein with 4Fe4S-binding SPASM domain
MSRIVKVDKKNRFVAMFDPETGFYMRTGVIDENGNETDKDPFMSSMPELLDIGIMGHCEHGLSGKCIKSGVRCYQNGLNTIQEHMTFEDFKSIVEQTKGKTFQYALGGRGDVNKHPEFEKIVEYCRDNHIVPNYTTSALNLTDKEIEITKKHCGAVAVSEYGQDYTRSGIQRFIKAGVKTNIHWVLGNNSIDEAIAKIRTNSFDEGINAVIFLLHKPVGLGKEENVLDVNDPRVKEFFELVDNVKLDVKIGFDSCTIPGILNFSEKIDYNSIDTCEGGRFSAYITPTMKMLPCSFDNQNERWAVNLRDHTVEEAWNTPKFNNFRMHLSGSCRNCDIQELCMGGCPIERSIVLCDREEKDQVLNVGGLM